MIYGESANWVLVSFVLLVAVALVVQRIDNRVKQVKSRPDRLSVTFFKIENDLAAIQDSLVILGRGQGEESLAAISKIRSRRPDILRHSLENGPTSAEILRGLEFPDPSDDKVFWADDRMERFGLNSEHTSLVSKDVSE